MIANKKSVSTSDIYHIAMDNHANTHSTREYPQQYRMVWIALIVIGVILIAEWCGILYQPIRNAQQYYLGDTNSNDVKKNITLIGTVRESKKGQGYFFLQTDHGEWLYVSMPYDLYDETTQQHRVWYPVGTTLQINGTVTLPDVARNPGGFDERAWLLSKKTGLKLDAEGIDVLSEPKGIWQMVYRTYETMESVLYQSLSHEQANLAMALLTGAKHRLDDNFYAMTQRMGIAHIFAVSGLHVGVIGSVVLWFFHHMGWMRSRLSFVILSIGLSIYCMLAGLPASALRAAGMILLSALALRLYRPPNAINFLAFAAIVLLLDNPFLLWNAGFQLSFGVTLALLLFVTPIQRKLHWIHREKLRGSIAVVLAAWLGSVPLTAWHFYTVTPISPLFNFILVPLVTLAVPMLLAGIVLSILLPKTAWCFLFPAKAALWLLQKGTEWLYGVSGRVQWNIGQPELFVLLLYAICLLLLWHWLNDKIFILTQEAKILPVLSILILLLCIPSTPDQDELLYLDTGQGSCAMLRTKAGEVILFDTGAQTKELSSVLAWYGVNRVDAVILSHGDTDHIKGMASVLDTVAVTQLFVEKTQMNRETMTELLSKAKHQETVCITVEYNTVLQLKSHQIALLPIHDNSDTTNSTELAAMLYFENGVAVFPGDLALSAVQQLVKKADRITIWTVPHHGSRNSGSAHLYALLRQKGVRYAVISAGRGNHYGHPHTEVLKWIDAEGISRYSTAEHGAILFQLSGNP